MRSALVLLAALLSPSVHAFTIGTGASPRCRTTLAPQSYPRADANSLRLCMPSEPGEGEEKPIAASQAQVDLVDRAQDPFRFVRVVLYATFGLVGLAGCAISFTKLGSDGFDAVGDLGVNLVVLAAGVGTFLFDRSVTAKLREKAEAELANPYLKGDVIKGNDDEDDA
jgi:hypothetical protein